MNDDDLSPDLELASAYLDGDVDDVQRAQVEASPELMAQVATFRQLSAALADTGPSDAASRDAAVAAALAEFDVLFAAPAAAVAVPLAPNVVPMRHHTRWSRVMLAAAAVALIGVVGVTAIKSLGSGSDDQSSGAVEPAAKDAGGAQAADTAGGDVPQTISAINGAAAVIPEIDEPAQLNTLNADSLLTSAPDTSAATTAATAAAGAESSIAADTTSPAAATDTTVAGDIAASPAPAVAPATRSALSFPFDCPLSANQVIIAEITWKGTPAVAVRDTVSGVTQAIDANCTVLASSDKP